MESLAAVMTTRCDREMNRWEVSGNICRSTVMRRANRYQKAIREHTRYHKGKRRPELVQSDSVLVPEDEVGKIYPEDGEEIKYGISCQLLHEGTAVSRFAVLPCLPKCQREKNALDDQDRSPIINDPMRAVDGVRVRADEVSGERLVRGNKLGIWNPEN